LAELGGVSRLGPGQRTTTVAHNSGAGTPKSEKIESLDSDEKDGFDGDDNF
jgi:hypothetical protein